MKTTAFNCISDESGISVVDAVGLLAIAILLIVAGFYVQRHQSTPKTLVNAPAKSSSQSTSTPSTTTSTTSTTSSSTTPSSTTNSSTTTTTTTSSSAATPNQNVITISVLGATITVPDSLKDLTYYAATNSNGHVVVNFSTQTLTNAIPGCSASGGTGAFDSIERGNGQYPGPANASSGALIKQYSSYYLDYILPEGPCAMHLTPANQTLLDDQSQDFYSSLSTVQATN